MQISSEKIKHFRKENGWSQDVLAKASGLSLRTIQRIEKDGNASMETQMALAAALEQPLQSLCHESTHTEILWKWRSIMQSLLALIVVAGAIVMLFALGGDVGMFADIYSAIFLAMFTYACTVIAFGSHGLIKSISGLRYLFTSEINASDYSKHLAFIYQKQLVFTYAGALIAFATGSIAILSHAQDDNALAALPAAWAVNILIILYAAIVAEGIFRPLIAKIEAANVNTK